MFSVIFEACPKTGQWDAYLNNAETLRSELRRIEGFVDNIRYKSLTRDGWLLSLSSWRNEKAIVRWRTSMRHHNVQEKGRSVILSDYRLRVGQNVPDNQVPPGRTLSDQRFDFTEAGKGTTITLITAKRPSEFGETSNPADCSEFLGLSPYSDGMLSWDVCEAMLTPGDLVLLLSWRDEEAAAEFEDTAMIPEGGQMRRIRVIRDYGMFDRREAPQYFPAIEFDAESCAH